VHDPRHRDARPVGHRPLPEPRLGQGEAGRDQGRQRLIPLPGGLKAWAIGAAALLLLVGVWQGWTRGRDWWVQRGIHQAERSGDQARQAIGAARAEAERLKAEQAAQLRQIAELKRQRDQAIAAASRERAEAARLTAVADELERGRREQPKIQTLVEARDAFKALGY
jgi:hypothetical protein